MQRREREEINGRKIVELLAEVLASAMLLLLVATVHHFLYYKVFIGKDGFYYQTHPFNGQHYDYHEIQSCREIKR